MTNNYAYQFGLKILLGLIFLLSAGLVMAQEEISGKIVNLETGESLPGANIFIKGTTTGTLSDLNGFFTIDVNTGDTLVFS
jgi:hypothetical protein